MKISTASANITAGVTYKLINCICNRIWEIGANNVPLVDAVASMFSIPIFEMESQQSYCGISSWRNEDTLAATYLASA